MKADVSIELPAVPRAAAMARAFVRDCLVDLGPRTLDDVTLCVSELVTNALDHAIPPYELRIDLTGEQLRVEVGDASPQPPALRPVSPNSARGRGMFIVSCTASNWGVDETSRGKIVWAEFRAEGDRD